MEDNSLARSIPHNIQAEQMVLGALLINNNALFSISEFLRPEHFFELLHAKIYESICIVNQKGMTANPISLKNMLHNHEAFIEMGGVDYLNKLTSLAFTIINVKEYARMVYDLALKRNLITIGEKIVNTAYESTIVESTMEQVASAESALFSLASQGTSDKGFIHLKRAMDESWDSIAKAIKNKQAINGITSGFIELDKKLGGFKESDLVIIAARPSMGKTALVVNLAINACKALLQQYCKDNDLNFDEIQDLSKLSVPAVGFFSLEMSAQQIANRIFSMEGKIETLKLASGHLHEEQINKLKDINDEVKRWAFFLDDTPALSIAAIRSRARRLKRNHNLSILFIDYLQLIRGEGDHLNRVQEISEITQNLKALAKELNIPIIALSQLSRAVEQRPDKRPLLSDLRESGSIEQDSDIVMFIYREEYYLARNEPPAGSNEYNEWQEKLARVHNKADIIVAKHRNGPVGNLALFYDNPYSRFSNYSDMFQGENVQKT